MEQPAGSPPRPKDHDTTEALATRLAGVWIWTVFFTLNGGLTYSLLGTLREVVQINALGGGWGGAGRFGLPDPHILRLVMPTAYAVGLLASVASWLFLYLYFVMYVVPVSLLGVRPESQETRRRLAAAWLNRTYQFLILAALARVTPDLYYVFMPILVSLGWS